MTITEFCNTHSSEFEFRAWALRDCTNMHQVWKKARPDRIIWIATRPGVLPSFSLRRFAVFCIREIESLITNPITISAMKTIDRYMRGGATIQDIQALREITWEAWESWEAWSPDRAVAWATMDDARLAAENAAFSSAWAVARKTAPGNHQAAARLAARGEIASKQAAWLRQNTKPNFRKL